MQKQLLIGCVGDDFTGSSDAASFLISVGLKTILTNGIPKGDFVKDCDAIVVALKSRTKKKDEAIKDSIEAFEWLRKQGAKHLYFKYCSTFDSTKEGNIGPVLDSVLEKYNSKYSVLCPALPVNKRTVKDGVLYVDGIPLSETHMKNHPITPMWASRLDELMKEQGKYEVLNINYQMLEKSIDEIKSIVDEFGKDKKHFYVVPDYIDENNASKIACVFGDDYILSGGSGILSALGKKYKGNADAFNNSEIPNTSTTGKGVIFAGSCSKVTVEQVAYFKSKNYLSYEIDPIKLVSGKVKEDDILNFILKNDDKEVLIYSAGAAGKALDANKSLKQKSADMLENTIANVAKSVVEKGYTRIIVAGGETSSAVVKKLGFDSFLIGQSIVPGVPVMSPIENKDLRIVLKSGNFGRTDFFERALDSTRE